MAITTENTYLLYGTTSSAGAITWTGKVCDIKEFPDLGSAPATVETTTLSDHMKTYLNGLVDPGNLEFNANYTPGASTVAGSYAFVKALEGSTRTFGIQFGKTGSDGVFAFQGQLSCWVKGGGTEAAVDMGISIAPSTEIATTTTTYTIS